MKNAIRNQSGVLRRKLARMSDAEIARLLRRSGRLRRPGKSRRIAGALRRWTAAEERLLGRWPDAELARRLGVSKQVISRYEESDYQTVAIVRLQEILDAIGIKTVVTLSA